MIACVCPAETVRSTPRRTSRLSPAASVTLACRSRISSVDIRSPLLGRQLDENVIAVDLHWIDRNGFGCGRPGWLAGAEVEAGSVQPALDGVVVHLALRQRYFLVRADIVQRKYLATGAHHRDRHARYLDPDGARLGQLRQGACAREGPARC